jgi:hypothetical protein
MSENKPNSFKKLLLREKKIGKMNLWYKKENNESALSLFIDILRKGGPTLWQQ